MTLFLALPISLARVCCQSVFLALGQIWANKTRSVLTTIGIIIGVASVTAVIAALTGLKSNVLSEFESFGTNKIFILPWRPDTGPMRHASYRLIRFEPEEFESLLDHCPSVSRFTRVGTYGQTISLGEKSIENVPVAGIDPSWHEVESRFVTLGRPFSLIDNTQARPVCLINPQVRDKLGLDRDCIGQSIFIGDRRFIITGIVEPRVEGSLLHDGMSGSEVFIPFETAWKLVRPGWIVIATSRSPEVSDEARAELSFFLRKQRHIKPGDPDTFRLEVVEKYLQQFNQIAMTITLVAAGVVGISLIVGGVGIMNIMLVSVSERTREIGLRKAVGARPSAILLQFLVEAVMLCFFGGLIGLALGQALTSALASIPDAKLDKAYIPSWAVLLSFGFAASVGLIFGMFPAVKAARLDPIEALRHE